MKQLIVFLGLSLYCLPCLLAQWDNNGDNPFNGSVNPIIERDNPYLIFDIEFGDKAGLRFRDTHQNLDGSIIYQQVDERISFGTDLVPNNAPVVVHLKANEISGSYSSSSSDGLFKIGEEADAKIVFDRDDIQAFGSNDLASVLRLNHHGGNINMGNGGITYVSATDKVGIGTTSPVKRLDVNGDVALSNGTGEIGFYLSGVKKAYVGYDGEDLSIVNTQQYPFGAGDVNIEAYQNLRLNTTGSISCDLLLETDGYNSTIGLTTDNFYSHINLTTLNDSSNINILSQGNIKLENTSPDGNLTLTTADTMSFSTSSYQASLELNTQGSSSDISISTNGGGSDIIMETMGTTSDINIAANGSFGDILLDAGSDVDIKAGSIIRMYNGDSLSLKINEAGQVGIGTSNPQFELHVAGDVDITGELSAASDRNLKKNISTLTDAMHIIARLNPVRYHFRTEDFPGKKLSPGEKMGLIAQELEEVLPELVVNAGVATHKNGENLSIKSVKYMELIPLLVKGIQEQQAHIEDQQKLMETILAENKKYKRVLDELYLRVTDLENTRGQEQ